MVKSKKLPSSHEFMALDAAKQKEISKKHKKLKKTETDFVSDKPGVLFLKHIPHGFYEPQMKSYFEQFGEVTRLRLARSKKTGRSKGYAFIEFSCDEVAKVAAETMNNYLMYERCLKCDVVPPEKVHTNTFRGPPSFYKPKGREKAIERYNNQSLDPDKVTARKERVEAKREKLQKKLRARGVEYSMLNLGINPEFEAPPRKLPKREDAKIRSSSNETSAKQEFEKFVDEYFEDEKDRILHERAKKEKGKKLVTKPIDDGNDSGIENEKQESVSSQNFHEDEEENKEVNVDVNTISEQEISQRGCVVDLKGLNITPEMIIDTEDDEITFKTPPKSVRVKRKSRRIVTEETKTPEVIKKPTKAESATKKKLERKRKLEEMKKILNMTM